MSEWQPIETAPKDGAPVLLRFKPAGMAQNMRRFEGLYFVGRFVDDDMLWRFAAPVGMAGISDDDLQGWMPLPEPLSAGLPPADR